MVTMLYDKLITLTESIDKLTKLNVISYKTKFRMKVYEEFKRLEIEEGLTCRMCRYEIIQDTFNFKHHNSVRNIIKEMESN